MGSWASSKILEKYSFEFYYKVEFYYTLVTQKSWCPAFLGKTCCFQGVRAVPTTLCAPIIKKIPTLKFCGLKNEWSLKEGKAKGDTAQKWTEIKKVKMCKA